MPNLNETSLASLKIGVMGTGNLASAIVKGLFGKQLLSPKQVWGVTYSPASAQRVAKELGIATFSMAKPAEEEGYASQLADTSLIVLGVKPAKVTEALLALKTAGLPSHTLVVSLAAGVKVARLSQQLGTQNPVIRAMCNTPCLVNQGITALCGNSLVQERHWQTVKTLFGAVGLCIEADESLFDAITALAASGPAFVFLMMEALADGGVNAGLPRKLAMQLVPQLLLGSAQLVQQTGLHPAVLKDQVTTPAGTTAAGLSELEAAGVRHALALAVEKATNRAKELGRLD